MTVQRRNGGQAQEPRQRFLVTVFAGGWIDSVMTPQELEDVFTDAADGPNLRDFRAAVDTVADKYAALGPEAFAAAKQTAMAAAKQAPYGSLTADAAWLELTVEEWAAKIKLWWEGRRQKWRNHQKILRKRHETNLRQTREAEAWLEATRKRQAGPTGSWLEATAKRQRSFETAAAAVEAFGEVLGREDEEQRLSELVKEFQRDLDNRIVV